MYQAIIVEDDPMVASINQRYLEAHGLFRVTGVFRNGEEAFDFLREHPADLALVDYYMPMLDGAGFLRKCREARLPTDIIMITAANSTKEIHALMQLGICDYLIKPFTKERFDHAIQLFLRYHGALEQEQPLSQEELDLMRQPIQEPRRTAAEAAGSTGSLPEKGIQLQTLNLIRQYLSEHPGRFFSSEEAAKGLCLSRITVRRYMNYLLEQGEIISQIDYATGGRPSIKYKQNPANSKL